jgi:hypothetical protein
VSLGDGLPLGEGERERLLPLLSSIASEPGARGLNPKQKKRRKGECEMVINTE